LPALFAKLITDEITKDDFSISTKLASPYPFPWQFAHHFKQDSFLVDAWTFLNQTPNKPFFKFHNVNGQFVLHYTIADIMLESCVACHNSHPESPKKDWKVGDVGGVLDVQISMNHVSKLINQQLSQTLVLFSLISIFIVLAAGLIIFKHRRYIQNIQLYIDQQTHDLALEVEQRKLFAEQSLLTRQEAEQANKAKSEFLANMSHELRTPMHGILSFARLGIKNVEKGDFQKLAKYFDRITISGERLLILLNDLLDLAKLETGQIKLQKETGNLRQLADTCVAEQEAWSKEKNITIAWKTFEKNITAEFDSPKIVQVISNLLSNAIKFSPENKQISLSCVAQDYLLIANKKTFPVLLFSIEDEGVGIPKAELNDIFDKFIQSSKTKTNAGGTGLGLAICKEIIEAHQGKIWAENAPEGGAIFKFIIPCSNKLEPTKTRPM
jgi:signal transduction histidine kinase